MNSGTSFSSEDAWENLDNHPALVSEIDPGNLHPATVALQALKYESEDPDANALSYKEEGNYFYSKKDLKSAINSYTGGLRAKSSDSKLNGVLFMNRALCHFYLKNYRSCIQDCKSAISLSPDYFKAYKKAIEACLILEKPDEAMEIANRGLVTFPDSKELLNAQSKALKLQFEISKKQTVKREEDSDKVTFQNIITSRGVKIDENTKPLDIPESVRPEYLVDSKGKIHWSVLFMYPEFRQTDFLRDVIETSTILDCLKIVFDPTQPPPGWDPKRLYNADEDVLEVYFEDTLEGRDWKSVPLMSTLKELTVRDDFFLRQDLIVILHVVSKRSSTFYNHWKTQRYV